MQTVVIESDNDNVADSAPLEPLSAVDVEARLNVVEFFFFSLMLKQHLNM